MSVVTVTMCILVRPAEMHTPDDVNTPSPWLKRRMTMLHKHVMELHQGSTDTPQFSMKVVSRHSTALDRQTTEVVYISLVYGSILKT